MTEQILSQPIKARVEFDFDTMAFFTLELTGPTIEDILDQIDMVENKVTAWAEKNFSESQGQRVKRILGFPTYRGKRTQK
jgi:hypothetical protein